ncbi:MAG: type II secretion system F family protein [Candidatus Lokiarchaeota archaeon]|nr:type II secretion system F family protein [Candidatus Lokiarchaeota archaeon]
MPEYRYIGLSLAGKPVQGTLYAENRWDLKKKLQDIIKEHRVNINKIEKKVTFEYKVRKGLDKPISGEQRAFSQAEVQRALLNMGFQIVSIRKKLFDFRPKIPTLDIVIFVRLCADLLREKFPYDEILLHLANDTSNRTLKETIREIHKDLKMGKEGFQVYGRHAKVLGKFTVHMLSIASTSGNMEQVYESTAKYLQRDADFKKSIRSALFMPVIVLVAIIATFIFYIMYIFPQMTGMIAKYDIAIPPMTKYCMGLSTFLQNNIITLIIGFTIPVLLLMQYFRTPKGSILFDRIMISLPVIGQLLHKSSIEIFARVFHALYSGSGENINVIKTAASACRNSYMEMKINEIVIPTMLREGKSFTECLEKTDVFPQNAIHRFRSGEESGTLRKSALQLADYYEKETTHKMSRVVDFINLIVSMLVTVLILVLTLISSEIGMVSPTSGPSGNF